MVVEKGFVLSVRITDELKARIDAAAKKAGASSPDWVRSVLMVAANQGAFAPRKTGDSDGRKKRKPA
jgi:antitoxin component of RelBE/YafQ-DinJ toxin-antitoxin module